MASAAMIVVGHKNAADTSVVQEDSRLVKKARKSATFIVYKAVEEATKDLLIDIAGLPECVAILGLDYTLPYIGERMGEPITIGDRMVTPVSHDCLSVWDRTTSEFLQCGRSKCGTIPVCDDSTFTFIPGTVCSSTTDLRRIERRGIDWSIWYNTGVLLVTNQSKGRRYRLKKIEDLHTWDPMYHLVFKELVSDYPPTVKLNCFTIVPLTGSDREPRVVEDSVPYVDCNRKHATHDADEPICTHPLFEISAGRFVQPDVGVNDDVLRVRDFYDCRVVYPAEGGGVGSLVKTKLKRPDNANVLCETYFDLNSPAGCRNDGWMQSGDMLVKSGHFGDMFIVWFDDKSWYCRTFSFHSGMSIVHLDAMLNGDLPKYVVCNHYLVVQLPNCGVVYRFSLDIRVVRQCHSEEEKARVINSATVELA